ncbi:MAG TPA: hypothetical protein VFX16_07945 [Pseudonocardiaceae bacterium]|nr:hypothetical protein [Pseudonocardiaceae bacterium]
MTDSLVLDIGGDIGALVIHTEPELAETEIELSPVGATTRSHNVVHPRHHGSGVTHSAVFPQLTAGTYTVWRDAVTPHGTVTVTGGQVAEYQMRSHGTAS